MFLCVLKKKISLYQRFQCSKIFSYFCNDLQREILWFACQQPSEGQTHLWPLKTFYVLCKALSSYGAV